MSLTILDIELEPAILVSVCSTMTLVIIRITAIIQVVFITVILLSFCPTPIEWVQSKREVVTPLQVS